MPIFGRIYEHGNLFIKFSIKFPEKISDELRGKLVELLGTAQTKKSIEECKTLNEKENGVSICKLQFIDPRQRTMNDTGNRGQDEYGDNEDMRSHG